MDKRIAPADAGIELSRNSMTVPRHCGRCRPRKGAHEAGRSDRCKFATLL